MGVIGIMAAYSARGVCVCISLYRKALIAFLYSEINIYTHPTDWVPSYTLKYTHAPRAEYAAITPTLSMSTYTIEPFL